MPKLGSAAFSLHFKKRVLLLLVVNRIYMFVCLFVFFLYCYRFVKFCGKNFVTFCKMGAIRPPETLLVFLFVPPPHLPRSVSLGSFTSSSSSFPSSSSLLFLFSFSFIFSVFVLMDF